jgi:hypothetical protein
MPLTSKGSEIMKNMKEEYGNKKGEEVFYASANKGTIKGVHNDRRATMGNDGGPGSGPQKGGGGRDPYASMRAQREKMDREDTERARGRHASSSDPKPERDPYASMKRSGAAERSKQAELERRYGPRSRDVSAPTHSSGPMSTSGPSAGKVNNLPDTIQKSDHKGLDCGREIGLDKIRDAGKNNGRY